MTSLLVCSYPSLGSVKGGSSHNLAHDKSGRSKWLCEQVENSNALDRFFLGGVNSFVIDSMDFLVIVKKSSPKNLSADCQSTVDQQVTDSLPTTNQQVTDSLRKKKICGKNEQLT